jgi:pimeloyl-ACP methyl ester carboxylesterase
MPYADNAGIRIHYQIDGTGPPLVLQHGFTRRLQRWADFGYVAALRPKYRLILIDARGHGDSDKPHDEASYAMDRRVADVTAVLDAVGVEKAHYWGYSMGGAIGFGMAEHAPSRVDALVIGASHPFTHDATMQRQLVRAGIAGGCDAFVAAYEKIAGPASGADATELRAGDYQAWLAASLDRDGMEDMLSSMAMRCCIYAGDADPAFARAKLASQRIANARFFSLPGLSHTQAFVESSSVLPPVIEFLGAAK